MRIEYRFKIFKNAKEKLFFWANQYNKIVCLNSNNYQLDKYSKYEFLIGVQAQDFIEYNQSKGAFKLLDQFYTKHQKQFGFGFLSYDLKNDLEDLKSENEDLLNFPELCFFIPKKVIYIQNNELVFSYVKELKNEIHTDYDFLKNYNTKTVEQTATTYSLNAEYTQEQYLQKIKEVQKYIQHGDFYEANFCMRFSGKVTKLNPILLFKKLNTIASSPFSSYFKWNDSFILSASPERYFCKRNQKIISQPIKGTLKRAKTKIEDEQLKKQLQESHKDHTENVMIVDLVRNDLSRIAQKGTVKVPEFCEVYSFNGVHQMISTITADLKSEYNLIDVVKKTFPMGSMTGVPKLSVLEKMELLETYKRGVYSGSIGYFDPDGDADFNVVIRTLLYNKKNQTLQFSVGGAITSLSVPEEEWNECLLKSMNIQKALT